MKGSKYYFMYAFKAVYVLGIIDPGTSQIANNQKLKALLKRNRHIWKTSGACTVDIPLAKKSSTGRAQQQPY